MNFKKPPSCYDSAREREALLSGLNSNPSFPENVEWGQPAPIKNKQPEVWNIVKEDMEKRNSFGKRKYGTPLQPFNGRDALRDAYEEALDLCVYLRTAIYEKDGK